MQNCWGRWNMRWGFAFKQGMPPDHARLQAFLGLPFLVDGDLVGGVALANRADGYSEREVVLLSPLCEIGGLMIAGYRNPQPG